MPRDGWKCYTKAAKSISQKAESQQIILILFANDIQASPQSSSHKAVPNLVIRAK